MAHPARVSQYVVEVLLPTDARSPSTITGAGVSQYVVETLMTASNAEVRVSQYVVEVLLTDGDTPTAPAEGGEAGTRGVHVFGYAG